MPSLTVENYVKTIYQICSAQAGESAGTGQIAAALAVSPSSVTSMLKTLSETGLATYARHQGVALTASGMMLALRVVRRHRLIELFLVQTLGLTWDEVHAEAENMEHAVSDWLIDRIDEFLGHPRFDPHGDPIPLPDGTLSPQASRTLADCSAGTAFTLVRVLDQSPQFLRYLSESGLSPGVRGEVKLNRAEAGIIELRVGLHELALSHSAAKQLLVE